jgi:hypothetical protein
MERGQFTGPHKDFGQRTAYFSKELLKEEGVRNANFDA